MLWKHSISSAVFGKKIAEHIHKVNSEEAFIASLLHDIGKGVLLKNKTDEFERSVQMIYNDNLTSIDSERSILGFTHVELGFLLMNNWRFSENIIETVIYHHNFQEYSGENLLVPIVSLANKLSHLCDYSFDKYSGELIELKILNFSEDDLEEIKKKAIPEIDTFLEIF